MKTDDLVNILAQDSSVRWRFGHILGMATAVGIAIAAIGFSEIGFRPDVAVALYSPRFLFKFIVTVSLAIVAMGALLRLARPGVPLGWWRQVLVLPSVLLLGGVMVELFSVPEAALAARWIGSNARICLIAIPLLAVGPLVCLLLALKHGAPQRPGIAGAIAGLAASGIAATFYAAHCPDDSPLFVATWYSIATAIVVLAGSIAGSKYLKW